MTDVRALGETGAEMSRLTLRGRSEELSAALGVLRRVARSGQSALVVLQGEPGIGKTALMEAVIEQAARMGFATGSAKAEKIEQIAPGAPLLLALRSGPRPLLDSGAFAELAALYGQQLWLVDRIAGLVEELSAARPVLIAIDDLQWADRLTGFALRALPGRLAGSPVVWLLSTRSSAAAHEVTQPADSDGVSVSTIPVPPLGLADIEDLAADHLGAVATGRARELLRGVGGNPFWAVQLLDGLARQRARGGTDDDLPAELVVSIRRRLLALPAEVVQLVELTAVWGRGLPVEDAAALLGDHPVGAVLETTGQAIAAGLLADDGRMLGFAHDLLREAVYADIDPGRRAELHLRSARRLLAAGARPVDAAPHYRAGAVVGDVEAVSVLREAATDCLTSVPDSAAELAVEALRLVTPGSPLEFEVGAEAIEILIRAQRHREAVHVADQLLSRTADAAAGARLQVLATRALWPMGRLAQMESRVAAALGRPGVPAPEQAQLTASRALALTRTGTARTATVAGEAALAEGIRLDDRQAVQLALLALGEAAKNDGRHAGSLDRFRTLRELAGPVYLAEEIRELQLLDRYDAAEALLAEARAAAQTDDSLLPSLLSAQVWQDHGVRSLDDAEAAALTLVRLETELGNYVYQFDAWMLLSSIALSRGDVPRARTWLEPALRTDLADDVVRLPGLQLMQGWVTAAEGDPTTAVQLLEPLLASARSSRSYWPWYPGWMRIFAGIGLAAGAVSFAEEAVAIAATGRDRNPGVASFDGVALQVQGLVAHDPAVLGDAVDVLRSGPRPTLLAGALADHGRALLRAGSRDSGVGQLEAALRAYEQLGAAGGAQAVVRDLDAAGVRVRRTPTLLRTGWESLTGTERRVAQLVSDGHSNRSAAEVLTVSPNTVGTHLKSVFAKLDVHSRVQLANVARAREADDVDHAQRLAPDRGR